MRTLTLQELQQTKTGPVWVLNSSTDMYPPGGDVFVTVNGPDNRPIPISIELTWLPKDLTLHAPRKSILESSYFYKAINEGILRIISEEDAQAILSKKGADREAERLRAQSEVVRQATRAKGISDTVTISGGSSLDDNQQIIDLTDVDQSFDDSVSASFKAWTSALNQLEEDDAISKIKTRGNLSIEECYYLKSNTTHDKIAEVISRKLKKV